VQQSDWLCRVEADGAIRIGLMYVNGLRKEAGQAMAAVDRMKTLAPPPLCAKCGCDDETMIEVVDEGFGLRAAGCGLWPVHRSAWRAGGGDAESCP
jgi:hypothetical protein